MQMIGPIEITDISQLTLQTKSGSLDVVIPVFQGGQGEAGLLFRFSPEAARQLYELLGKAQQFLETEIAGDVPSNVRH